MWPFTKLWGRLLSGQFESHYTEHVRIHSYGPRSVSLCATSMLRNMLSSSILCKLPSLAVLSSLHIFRTRPRAEQQCVIQKGPQWHVLRFNVGLSQCPALCYWVGVYTEPVPTIVVILPPHHLQSPAYIWY